MSGRKVVVIGAGPAGLTAAHELCKLRVDTVVLEKDNVVGGIARTMKYKGYHFDIGGHRFFTKVGLVQDLWQEILGGDLLLRKRLSRIYYDGKFFNYPLRPANALSGLGLWNSILVLLSYLRIRVSPIRDESTFEDWVSNRFGRRLYRTFFKTYTEKVWGIPCDRISAEWAAQRIRGLSLLSAVRNALFGARGAGRGGLAKTLVDAFHYPKYGPGMMWEQMAELAVSRGCEMRMETQVERILLAGNSVRAVEVSTGGRRETIEGTDFIASLPLRELVHKLDPAAPRHVIEAAERLSYRDFLTVALIVDREELFPDNWIYIHDPGVRVGRIQNFKNWSPHMVPDSRKSCIGLEYFCFEGDDLWNMAEEQLIDLGKSEMHRLGLIRAEDVIDGRVVRMPKAYPVYDETYAEAVRTIREYLTGIDNLLPVGRNGMHKYNNQDHSMLTAMLAVRNLLGENHDLWSVNADQEYHEELTEQEAEVVKQLAAMESTQPRVPATIGSPSDRDRSRASG